MGNETESIKKAALDYIEGWYSASPERMERALHPELAKRIVLNIEGTDNLRAITSERLVEAAKSRNEDKEALDKIECEILDAHGDMACVKTVCPDFIDYIHLAKWDGQWKIINVLWEFTPEGRKRMEAAQKQK
ncbi:MAG: nuclear transport factor 2 family protein [Candidatus Zixiibacteriota bacterium]|nr:MAG: nuclear transport factor 2 family protein [candidate division Zixibacteria bacterium]